MLHDRSSTRTSATSGSSLRSNVTGVSRSSRRLSAVARRVSPNTASPPATSSPPPSCSTQSAAPSSTASGIARAPTSLRTTTSHGSSSAAVAGSRDGGRTVDVEAGRRRARLQVVRARRRALDVEHPRARIAPTPHASSVLFGGERIAGDRDRAPRARARRPRRRSTSSGDGVTPLPTSARPAARARVPPIASSTQRRGRRAGCRRRPSAANVAPGGERVRQIERVDPRVAERRATASGSTETGMPSRRQPRDRRRRTSPAVGAAVGEQHDPRHVAGRQLGARRASAASRSVPRRSTRGLGAGRRPTAPAGAAPRCRRRRRRRAERDDARVRRDGRRRSMSSISRGLLDRPARRCCARRRRRRRSTAATSPSR